MEADDFITLDLKFPYQGTISFFQLTKVPVFLISMLSITSIIPAMHSSISFTFVKPVNLVATNPGERAITAMLSLANSAASVTVS